MEGDLAMTQIGREIEIGVIVPLTLPAPLVRKHKELPVHTTPTREPVREPVLVPAKRGERNESDDLSTYKTRYRPA